MVNSLLLHPYKFHDLDTLVRVWEDRGIDEGYDARRIAPADAEDLRGGTQVFESMTTFGWRNFNLSKEGNIQPVLACRVSANFFDVLGAAPAAGRLFTPSEEQAGLDQVAVVSHGMWPRRFGRDPPAIGKTRQLKARGCTVVGIKPPGRAVPPHARVSEPLTL